MAASEEVSSRGVKRKRAQDASILNDTKTKTKRSIRSSPTVNESDIATVENEILKSRKNYNKINGLLRSIDSETSTNRHGQLAIVALCRIFCKLLALGELSNSKNSSENEATISRWLGERLRGYEETLRLNLKSTKTTSQTEALSLLMRLQKEKEKAFPSSSKSSGPKGPLARILSSVCSNDGSSAALNEFISKYLVKYKDVRYETLSFLADASLTEEEDGQGAQVSAILSILCSLQPPTESSDDELEIYFDATKKTKHTGTSLAGHKNKAEKAWTKLMRHRLTKTQRKTVLECIPHQVAPWFLKPELLMDFLTDSYNVGGSTSLVALSGLFHLMQAKNLDYPEFYIKLYSLLDGDILHSTHRSRFFRLLDTFLASTHLPAALVASFMKRLSRLSLHGPPAAAVGIVPWVYNLLKTHPTCTFMLQREHMSDAKSDGQWGDPFSMEEKDPMETGAIESSLWELHTLQSHYHPNVAAIAKIISEQFTKQAYNVEDFLDHSYATMTDLELSKELKKPPAIEYEIPKKILTRHDPANGAKDNILVQLWDFT